MSTSRRTDRADPIWDGITEPDPLTSAIAKQIVSAIVSGDPHRADELANLLLSLERELSRCQDPTADPVIEQIDRLVEMAFQQSEPYNDYLEVYRMTVHQRCRTTLSSPGSMREGPGFQDLVHMVIIHGKRFGKPT